MWGPVHLLTEHWHILWNCWSNVSKTDLLAPVHTIFPELKIRAVVRGSRILIITAAKRYGRKRSEWGMCLVWERHTLTQCFSTQSQKPPDNPCFCSLKATCQKVHILALSQFMCSFAPPKKPVALCWPSPNLILKEILPSGCIQHFWHAVLLF